MSRTKHTPGPWVVGPVDDTVVTHLGADGTCYEIAAIDGDYNDPDTWPIMEANARLIAAAPELLDTLTALLEVHDAMGAGQSHAATKARVAIAKATGAA